mmetsp:Transcript_5089/g.7443  ORF Transcript_5089/g.7443 Transcript_5089/m.7443 type:complete len:120 (-) Transcript_5089:61-420(-)
MPCLTWEEYLDSKEHISMQVTTAGVSLGLQLVGRLWRSWCCKESAPVLTCLLLILHVLHPPKEEVDEAVSNEAQMLENNGRYKHFRNPEYCMHRIRFVYILVCEVNVHCLVQLRSDSAK